MPNFGISSFAAGLSNALTQYMGMNTQLNIQSELQKQKAEQAMQLEQMKNQGEDNNDKYASFDEINQAFNAAGKPELGQKLIDIAKQNGSPMVPRKSMDSVFKGLGISNQDEKNQYLQELGQARQTMAQNAVTNTVLRYSAAGGAPKAISEATERNANIARAKAIVDQIEAQGGQATIRQRTELASATARSINPTGVLTNEALNLYVPQSLRQKFGNWQEYLTNESAPVDFTGFTNEFKHLLDRETGVNSQIIQSMNSLTQPSLSSLASGANVPMPSSTPPSFTPTPTSAPSTNLSGGVTSKGTNYRIIQ